MTKFEDIPNVRQHLLAFCPFIASFLFGLEMIIDDSPKNKHKTAYTDGKVIAFHSQFLMELSYKELITLVAHEVAHVAFAHHFRMSGRDHELWNVACDHAINLLLTSMGFTPLSDWCCDSKYKGMSAEDIYADLKQQSPEKQEQQKQKSQGSGGNFEEPKNDDGSDMSESEKEEAKQKAKEKLVQAKGNMKMATRAIEKSSLSDKDKEERKNQIGKGMKELIADIDFDLEPKLDWREILNRFLTSLSINDFAIHVPDLRFEGSEFLLPSLHSEEIGNVFFALDVSGSCARQAKEFVTEAKSILENMEGASNSTMKACYCSDRIHAIDTITSESDIKLIYGGGTKFAPAVDAFKDDHDSECLIYITDGCVWPEDIGKDPMKPVLWVLTRRNDRFKPAFGEIVHMNN